MARPSLIVLLAALTAPARADAADWSRAGGALLVAPRAELSADLSRRLEPRTTVQALPFAEEIALAAARHGVDPKLLSALVAVESGFRADAVSPAGAAGLTQLMPATAAELGVRDRFEPMANLLGGSEYLARQIRRFGDLELALAAFNSGPERVARLGRVPDIPETTDYVAKVIGCLLALHAGREVRSSGDCRSAKR